jgi:ketosteroid isomerase-like protein
MKNNISVFILIILVASSFKYRSKTIDSKAPASVSNTPLEMLSLPEGKPKAELESLIDKMQQANQDLGHGNAEPIKELWSHGEEVTIFCGSSGVEVKGWNSVNERLDWLTDQISKGSSYTYEKISLQASENFASLQQTEHYKSPEGLAMDLGVTILFKKETSGWKIVHRHAENLSSRVASM